MQPLFHESEPPSEGASPLSRLIPFEVPPLSGPRRQKRHRSSGRGPSSALLRSPPSRSVFFWSSPQGSVVFRALRGFLELGDRPHAAYAALMATFAGPSWSSAVRLRGGREGNKGKREGNEAEGEIGGVSGNTVERLSRAALQQALALVCGVIAADSEGRLLLPTLPNTSSLSPPRGVMALYCALQGLGLELEDVSAQLALLNNTTNNEPNDINAVEEKKREGLRAQLDRILRQVEQCVNAMEQTLIDIILSIPQDSDFSLFATMHLPTSHGTLSYTAGLFKRLGDIFKEYSWPFQLLASSASGLSTEPFSEGSRHAGSLPDDLTLLDLLPHLSPDVDSSLSQAELLFHVGEGVTAILIATLRTLRQGVDGGNCLGIAPATPLARMAAALPFQSTSTFANGRAVIRPAVDLQSSSFSIIEAKAWAGQYALVGLRRAHLEMQGLFFKLFHSLGKELGGPTNELPSRSTAAIQRRRFRDLRFLWDNWNRSIQWHYTAFWQRLGLMSTKSVQNCDGGNLSGADDSLPSFDLKHDCVFDILASNKVDSLTAPQQAALRIINYLQSFDKKDWFRFPAFDLANFDFTSIVSWIQSPSFALKSNRAVFDALRRVLEHMVDVCVRKYGPLHKFSECISSIRQRLVHASQTEGLL
ncbi:unnamed protein product [Phytomonas sp. Hart1]|nr:unnamed protein product [Phytomonas sp. Hart1]|eukprot:CCW66554.1 unnamed protein product [Phytomonas sp. isolate Hart1]